MKHEDQKDLAEAINSLLFALDRAIPGTDRDRIAGVIKRMVAILARNVNTGTAKKAIKEATK